MGKIVHYRTLVIGILSPVIAGFLGSTVYRTLTRASENRDADFVFRLSMTAAAMSLPFVLTLVLALRDRARSSFTLASKMGLLIAALSLGMLWVPINGAVSRWKQTANLALNGAPAPHMETLDLDGEIHRLSDYRGQVVLLNIWATWCAPCRKEMPALDRLYKDKASDGLMVLGLSMEEAERQREFNQELRVSYPLLTSEGTVPELFRSTARFPANFLIDRQGLLRPAPSTDEPFENLVRAVEDLLERSY
jgi:peroxiredoxin